MEQLAGNVAVVTGSASGLGRAMAERFAREGMIAVVADNRGAEAEITAKEINESAEKSNGGRAVAVEVDVTQRDSVDALADRVADTFVDASPELIEAQRKTGGFLTVEVTVSRAGYGPTASFVLCMYFPIDW